MREMVPLAPLREAFLRSGRTAGDVARHLDWQRADTQRVQRALGMAAHHNRHGRPHIHVTTSYDRALALAEAIGVDPVDVGL